MSGERVASQAEFRDVMGRFATGVTLVTGMDRGETPVGLTANAVASVSLHPPLLMVGVDRESSSLPTLLETGRFGVSVLRAEHEHLAHRFSVVAPEERFAGLELRRTSSGIPILEDGLAWMDCRLWRPVEAGDHILLLGEVIGCGSGSPGQPLVFFQGGYGTVAP